MVTVGYKSGKVQYNASTGKVCEGCCEEAETCTFCPTDTTPLTIEVAFSDLVDECGGCISAGDSCGGVVGAAFAGKFNFSLADLINGTHTLFQVGPGSCRWEKELDLGTDRKTDIWCNCDISPPCDEGDCPDCGGTPFFSIDAESETFPLKIVVLKVSSTEVTISVADSISSTGVTWSSSTTGTTKCFELTGTISVSGNLLGVSTTIPLLSGNNVTITE